MDSLDGSGQGPVMGSCEHSNEPSGSTGGEFLDYLSNSLLFKKDCSMELVPFPQSDMGASPD
jgi:hypothetical protein